MKNFIISSLYLAIITIHSANIFAGVDEDIVNAARIFYPIKFANPLIVTPDIKKFTVSFGVSGSVSLDFDTDGNNNLINLKAGADPFTMKFSAE